MRKFVRCGTGELIADALEKGARRIFVAVGGSATVDGGAGALQAMGARFFDRRLAALPRWVAFLQERSYALLCVFSLHQFVKINFFSACQAFVEMD